MLPLVLLLTACNGDNEIKSLKPDILLSPEVLDFGAVVEDYSLPLELEILNAGRGVLEIDGVTIDGEGAAAFSVGDVPAEVAHDSAWPLQVTFNPKDPLPYTAILHVASNDPDTPELAVALTGQGIVAPTPDIECDPVTLDFGVVPVGGLSTLWTTCTNVGDDDLYISSWSQSGGGSFTLASNPTGYVLPPDQSLQLIVVYNPTVDSGDNGKITLLTNDPDEPTTDVTLLGNGGGDFDYPVAIATGPSSAEPRTTITVDGSDSYGDFEPLVYHWSVEGPYDTVATTESGAELYVQLDLAGHYRVELQVEDTRGVLSAPAFYEVDAVPTEDFHVELLWGDVPDLDLHLLTSDGELFLNPDDCNYCNPNPDWGALGGADDPTLDLDARSSPPGLENINIDSPADDSYFVKVHYFEESGGGDVAATVNIYLYGALEASYTRVLQRDDVWDVAQVVWPDGYVVEQDTALYSPDRRVCQ